MEQLKLYMYTLLYYHRERERKIDRERERKREPLVVVTDEVVGRLGPKWVETESLRAREPESLRSEVGGRW